MNHGLKKVVLQLLEALENIENDERRIPENIWAMRNAAIAKAKQGDLK